MGSANVQHPGSRDRRGVWWGPRMLLTGSRKLREDHAFAWFYSIKTITIPGSCSSLPQAPSSYALKLLWEHRQPGRQQPGSFVRRLA